MLGDNKLRDVSSDVVIVKLVCNEDIINWSKLRPSKIDSLVQRHSRALD